MFYVEMSRNMAQDRFFTELKGGLTVLPQRGSSVFAFAETYFYYEDQYNDIFGAAWD